MKMTPYQTYIAKSRYSRYLDDKGRREHWNETVKRYFDFMEKHLLKNHSYTLTEPLRSRLENAVINLDVMPSMRSLMTAGEALERQNIAGYNCSFLPIDDPKAFDEAMYILLCGTGVGFSVERKYVNKLPEIPETLYESNTVVHVKDSKEDGLRRYDRYSLSCGREKYLSGMSLLCALLVHASRPSEVVRVAQSRWSNSLNTWSVSLKLPKAASSSRLKHMIFCVRLEKLWLSVEFVDQP